jgi:CRISPR-associated endonuclease/helicase Cas3
VFVFLPEKRKLVGERQQRARAAEAIMQRHDDPLSLEAVHEFFAELYWIKGGGLDEKKILEKHGNGEFLFPFEWIAREFRMIEEGMMPVIVPFDVEAEELAARLHVAPRVGAIARKLQRYVVQIPPKALAALLAAGSVAEVAPPESEQRFHVLTNKGLYRDDVGLTWDDPTWREAEALIV